jgi:hypothetical protein
MKSVKILLVAILVGAALSLTAKANDLTAGDAFSALAAFDDIKQCQETLKNLERLIKLSSLLVDATGEQYRATRTATLANRGDSKAAEAYKNAVADNRAAIQDLDKLGAWRDRMVGRIQSDRLALEESGITGWEEGRQAAKDAARGARESSTDAVRQTGSEAGRGGMAKCPDGH